MWNKEIWDVSKNLYCNLWYILLLKSQIILLLRKNMIFPPGNDFHFHYHQSSECIYSSLLDYLKLWTNGANKRDTFLSFFCFLFSSPCLLFPYGQEGENKLEQLKRCATIFPPSLHIQRLLHRTLKSTQILPHLQQFSRGTCQHHLIKKSPLIFLLWI